MKKSCVINCFIISSLGAVYLFMKVTPTYTATKQLVLYSLG